MEAREVAEYCWKHDIPEVSLFETAYLWRFGKVVNLHADVHRYRYELIVPKYVEKYLESRHGN